MSEITQQTFLSEFKSHFARNPSGWLMIRPDRTFDKAEHRYLDDASRRKGDAAMKAWFEYLAAKWFIKTMGTWAAILKSGRSIMVVCADPLAFDLAFVPPETSVLQEGFWREFELSRVPLDRRFRDEARSARILGMISDLRIGLKSMREASRKPTVGPAREWKSTPAEEYQTQPPPRLSDELLARMVGQ